jgi:hypothetical protein
MDSDLITPVAGQLSRAQEEMFRHMWDELFIQRLRLLIHRALGRSGPALIRRERHYRLFCVYLREWLKCHGVPQHRYTLG